MKRYLPIVIIFTLLLAASLSFITQDKESLPPLAPITSSKHVSEPTQDVATKSASISAPPETLTIPFTLIVPEKTYALSVGPETSLYDAMHELSQKGELLFSATYHSGIGYFIDEISGIKNGGGKYWFFYVNGESSTVGVSSYLIKPHDNIEWRFKESN